MNEEEDLRKIEELNKKREIGIYSTANLPNTHVCQRCGEGFRYKSNYLAHAERCNK